MTTVSSATATNGTLTQANFNPYAMFDQGSMAHDFFGSQIFGTGGIGQTTQTAPQGNGSTASNIMQQYMKENGGSAVQGQLTAQDYMTASQIANMFSGGVPMFYQNTSFFDKDMFAQTLQMPYPQGVNYSA